MLYPFKFKPIYKTKVWGGDKIRKIKNDKNVPEKCGESWEVSGLEGDESIISNGFLKDNSLNEIIEIYMEEVVGDKVFEEYGYEFPILLKIIDAKENLSVQVHPDDEVAAERHNARGKTEAWYILDADENAKIIDGFNCNMDEESLRKNVVAGNLEEVMKYQPVKAGEFYMIPAGRVHGLCAGTSVVEIQETSDITYRIYDYNRGNRELHTDLAVDVIDYHKNIKGKIPFEMKPDKSNEVVENKYFNVNYLPVMNVIEKDYGMLDSFVIYHCLYGSMDIKTEGCVTTIEAGETVLIPASIQDVVLVPKAYTEVLEVYMKFDEDKKKPQNDFKC